MATSRTVPVPPRRPPSRSGSGTPCRRRCLGRAAPCLALALALGIGLAGTVGLLRAATDPPPVAIDDGNAALACSGGGTVQGAVVAVPAAQPAPAGAPAADAAVFRVAYDLSTGSGTLTRAPLVRDGAGMPRLADPLWEAGAMLAAMAPAARRLHTLGDAGLAVPFDWPGLSSAQRAALDRPPGSAIGDGLGPGRVAWLRGERALEGGTFRRRAGMLGDAVRGTPLYLGAGLDPTGDAAHAAFHERTLRRTPAVYLGANDGMLHAFDAGTGAELFAYFPAMLLPALSALPAPGTTHRPYVDGPLAAGEAIVGGAWRSVLVGAPGAGAQGLFALDVSDPAAFDAGLGALWEFTERDDAAIGNVMQPAQVARLKLRNRNGVPEYGHFAIAGNGLNAYAADGARGGAHGALFLLALDKPPAERWRLDTNYYRLDTPPGDPALPSGLGGPALVTGDGNVLRHVYAGDLQGNLWRFDFNRNAPWRTNPAWRPVFVARDAAGRPQPITQPPKIVHAEGGGYLVLFGTGSLYGRAEREPASWSPRFAPQSFYAIHDDPGPQGPVAPLGRADLVGRRAEVAAGGAGVTISGSLASIGGEGRPRGWYLDFADGALSGERSLASAAIADGRLVFTTVVPGTDPCADSASRRYVLDALAGLPADGATVPARGVTGLLVPGPLHGAALLLPGPRIRAPRDPAGRIRVTRDTAIVHFGADGQPLPGGTSTATWPAGRLSWREVANWRRLHRLATGGEGP